MQTCKGSHLPMDPSCQLKHHIGTPLIDPQLYCSLVGSLMYVTNTRPDISHVVSTVSYYMDNPKEAHLQATKQILCYLGFTKTFGFHFSSHGQQTLYTFADADWGRDLETRCSTTSLLHKFGNSYMDWTYKLQPTVSLSTIEAK
jgi:hypothetical protein